MMKLMIEGGLLVLWSYVLWRLRIYRHERYGVTLIASSFLLIVGLIVDILVGIGLVRVSTNITEMLMIISMMGIAFAGLYMLRHWEDEHNDDADG